MNDILYLIVYISPGFIALSILKANWPGKRMSDFAQASYSILLGAAIVSAIQMLGKGFYDSAGELKPLDFLHFALLLFCGVAVGYLLSWCNSLRVLLAKKCSCLSGFAPDPVTVWNRILTENYQDYSVVFLRDGTIYLGWVKHFTLDVGDCSPELLLTNARRVDDKLELIYEIVGGGVYISEREIIRIEFVSGQQA